MKSLFFLFFTLFILAILNDNQLIIPHFVAFLIYFHYFYIIEQICTLALKLHLLLGIKYLYYNCLFYPYSIEIKTYAITFYN